MPVAHHIAEMAVLDVGLAVAVPTPLSEESGVIRHIAIIFLSFNLECGLAVSADRGGEHIKFCAAMSGGKAQGVCLASYDVERCLGVVEVEVDAV